MKLKKDGTPKQKPGTKPKGKEKVKPIQFYKRGTDIELLGGPEKVKDDHKEYFDKKVEEKIAELKLKKGKA